MYQIAKVPKQQAHLRHLVITAVLREVSGYTLKNLEVLCPNNEKRTQDFKLILFFPLSSKSQLCRQVQTNIE